MALFCNNTKEHCAAGHLIFTRIQGPSRNVLGVVIKKQFKTRQPFSKATSGGKFNSHPLKKIVT